MAKRVISATTSQDLSSGALSLSCISQGQMEIAQITIHASVGVSETVTLTLDQSEGSNYDVVIDSSDLNTEQDYVYKKSRKELILNNGDAVKLQCTNANTTGIVYAKILLIEV